MRVRELHEDEREWLRETLRQAWSGDTVVLRGEKWAPGELPALVAVDESGELVGVATYAVEGDTAELITLNAFKPGIGVGPRLVDAVAAAARAAGATRLRVMTTNDNTRALRLYQQAGFRLTELRPGGIDRVRATLKPSIPTIGNDGIPIRDELDLVLDLEDG